MSENNTARNLVPVLVLSLIVVGVGLLSPIFFDVISARAAIVAHVVLLPLCVYYWVRP